MANGCSARSSEIEHLFSGCNEDVIQATKDACRQLAPEGVPNAVFGLGPISALDRNTFFAVDSLSWDQILRDKKMLLALGNENTGVTVRLKDDIGSSPRSATTTSGTSPSTSTSSLKSYVLMLS